MRRAGKVVAEMHEVCTRAAVAGATTLDVDRVAREVLERRGARSNFLNYHGFPAVVCTSPNEVIVHGIPSASVVLEEGDILSIDCGAIIEGWHADAAVTVPIGAIDDESKRLIEVTRRSLEAGDRTGGGGQAARRHRRRGRRDRGGRRVQRRARVRGSRDRYRDARGSRRSRTTAPPGAGSRSRPATSSPSSRWSTWGPRAPRRSATAGRSSRVTARAPRTSSTPSPSPTTAPRSSPSPDPPCFGVNNQPLRQVSDAKTE